MPNESDITKLKKLSAAQLEDFCRYWNSGPFRDGNEPKRRGRRFDSDLDFRRGYYSPFLLSDGWILFDHKYDEQVLLCDEDGIIRLKGNKKEIVGLLLNIVLTEQMLETVHDREYGLVLSGGGAKGAFEIGVWRWLQRTGLDKKITGISGTSVGALNSILFSCTSLEEAERIWRSVRQKDLTRVNKETLKRIAEIFLQTLTGTAIGSISAPLLMQDMMPMTGESFFTQEKLSEIVDEVLKSRFPRDRVVFSCLARQSLQQQKEPPAENALQAFHNADYYCLNNRNVKEISKIVLASSALPLVYDPVRIHHFEYRDGGCRDNTPCMPLIRSGFRKLIVVHLSERGRTDPTVETVGDTVLFHVYPTLRVKHLIDTMLITEESTEEWINNGEQAATSQLGPYFRDGGLEPPAVDKQDGRLEPPAVDKQDGRLEPPAADRKDGGLEPPAADRQDGGLELPAPARQQEVKETDMDKFDFENFNYEDAFRLVQSEVSKPNILICGVTGIGKSTLIRDIFAMSEAEGPEIGNRGRARTTGVHPYRPAGATMTLYDSQGYEIGTDEHKYMKEVLKVIDDKIKMHPDEMQEHIHEVWYCVSAANNRFFEADEKMIRKIRQKYKIPVMVILTKVDCVDEDGIIYLKKAILEKLPDISIFTYACDEKTADWDEETRKKYVQKDEIIEWALDHLDQSLRAGFIPAVKKSLEVKRNYIARKVIPKYAGLAWATVAATSIISVPFTDSVPLMALQVKMCYEIIKGYGIRTEGQQIAANLVGTSAVSVFGRSLASNLIRVIPVAGGIVNATVNTTVAASVTAVLGFAIALVCEQYLAACVDNNGVENLPFGQFMDSGKLKEAIQYVTDNKKDYNIQGILDQVAKDAMNRNKDSRNLNDSKSLSDSNYSDKNEQ